MSIAEVSLAVPAENRERFLSRVAELEQRARERGSTELERALALRVLVVLSGGIPR